jgi:hypothetical protein
VVELQAFLGLFNYYRKFVPAAAKIVKPLTDALQGGLRPQHKIQWSEEQQQAFLAAKAAIAATAQLAHLSPTGSCWPSTPAFSISATC